MYVRGGRDTRGADVHLEHGHQSSRYVNYGLSRIPERYVDVERERLEDGEAAFFSPPSYFVFVDGGGIGAGISGSAVMENIIPGVYALWCANELPPATIYVTALLEVTE